MPTISEIQADLQALGYQWVEHIFNDGLPECYVQFSRCSNPHVFDPMVDLVQLEQARREILSWGRFSRKHCWDRAYEVLVISKKTTLHERGELMDKDKHMFRRRRRQIIDLAALDAQAQVKEQQERERMAAVDREAAKLFARSKRRRGKGSTVKLPAPVPFVDVPRIKNFPEDSVQCNYCGGTGSDDCRVCGSRGWLVPRQHPQGRLCENQSCREPLRPDHVAVYCSNACAAESSYY